MQRLLSGFLVLVFLTFTPAVHSFAGSRYYSHSYSNHYPSGYYSRHYPRSYYNSHYYPRRHSYHSDRYLTYLGVGLLTGVVVGSILSQPPAPRTVVYPAQVVYSAPPPVIVHSQSPVFVSQQPTYPSDYESILRQVRPSVQILNIRSGPGFEEEVIGQAILGEILGVIGAAPGWLYVKTEEGRYGWVKTEYTQEMSGPVG